MSNLDFTTAFWVDLRRLIIAGKPRPDRKEARKVSQKSCGLAAPADEEPNSKVQS